MHLALQQIKYKDTLIKDRIAKTHTSQLCPSFYLWISPKNPLDTNKQACKQTNRQANHACTHTSCPYQRPDMTERACRLLLRPCGSVTWETEPRQTGQRVVGAWCGRSYCIRKQTTYCCTCKG